MLVIKINILINRNIAIRNIIFAYDILSFFRSKFIYVKTEKIHATFSVEIRFVHLFNRFAELNFKNIFFCEIENHLFFMCTYLEKLYLLHGILDI